MIIARAPPSPTLSLPPSHFILSLCISLGPYFFVIRCILTITQGVTGIWLFREKSLQEETGGEERSLLLLSVSSAAAVSPSEAGFRITAFPPLPQSKAMVQPVGALNGCRGRGEHALATNQVSFGSSERKYRYCRAERHPAAVLGRTAHCCHAPAALVLSVFQCLSLVNSNPSFWAAERVGKDIRKALFD